MFRALLTDPQEVLHKRTYTLRACYVSWLHHDWSGTDAATWHNMHAVY
jgi:hypothetical protein